MVANEGEVGGKCHAKISKKGVRTESELSFVTST